MRLVAFDGGFGRIEDDRVITMGRHLVEYPQRGESINGEAAKCATSR